MTKTNIEAEIRKALTQMTINKNTYYTILNSCLGYDVETGGIIGGTNNIISEFVFDKGTESGTKWLYYPNIEKLNLCIQNWQDNEVEFYGIVHSHFQEKKELSFGDSRYIQEIMSAMPASIKHLYFPVIIPGDGLVAFKASQKEKAICIEPDTITLI